MLLKHIVYLKHKAPCSELAIRLERLLEKGTLPCFYAKAHMYSQGGAVPLTMMSELPES